jgi:hypothetical protein
MLTPKKDGSGLELNPGKIKKMMFDDFRIV